MSVVTKLQLKGFDARWRHVSWSCLHVFLHGMFFYFLLRFMLLAIHPVPDLYQILRPRLQSLTSRHHAHLFYFSKISNVEECNICIPIQKFINI